MLKRISLLAGVSALAVSLATTGALTPASAATPDICTANANVYKTGCSLQVSPLDRQNQEEAGEEVAVNTPIDPIDALHDAIDAWINGGDADLANPDNDGDQIPDVMEIILGMDPSFDEVGNGAPNFDGDYFPDAFDPDPNTNSPTSEVASEFLGWPTLMTDTDGDTIPDHDEMDTNTNPFDPDSDHDGVDDAADNFPTDPNQQKIVPPPGQGGGLQPPMWHWDNSGSGIDQDHGADQDQDAEADGNESTDSNSGGTAGPGGGLNP